MCGGEDDHLMLPLQEPFKPPPVRLDSSGARVYSVAKEELNKITEEVPPLFQVVCSRRSAVLRIQVEHYLILFINNEQVVR